MKRLTPLCLGFALAATAAEGADMSQSSQAGGATVTVSIPQGEIQAGQPLQVLFTIDHPPQTDVRAPQIMETLGNWQVRKAESLPVSTGESDRVVERLTLATFESGERKIPCLEFTLRDAEGRETALVSPELTVQVRSLLGDETDPTRIRDLKAAVIMPLDPVWMWYAGGVLMVAVLGALAFLTWRTRLKVSASPELPHARALRELSELATRQLPQKGLVLDFYVLLSDTVRRYVEGRFGIRAPEQTTKEFLQVARHHPAIREGHQRMLATFLRASDMVKFAAQRPGPAECDRGLEAARGFVRESMPDLAHHTPGAVAAPRDAEAER